jgi:hypothetical protein
MQATEDETAERRALEVQRQHLVELMSMNGRILQLLSEISVNIDECKRPEPSTRPIGRLIVGIADS